MPKAIIMAQKLANALTLAIQGPVRTSAAANSNTLELKLTAFANFENNASHRRTLTAQV